MGRNAVARVSAYHNETWIKNLEESALNNKYEDLRESLMRICTSQTISCTRTLKMIKGGYQIWVEPVNCSENGHKDL